MKHEDPKYMYDDPSQSLNPTPTRSLAQGQANSNRITYSLSFHDSPHQVLLQLEAPSQGIHTTPKTPRSGKHLTNNLLQFASQPSLSPFKITSNKSKLTKLIHSAQFAHAKVPLTEEARLQQKEEDHKTKAHDQPCGHKKISSQGQAFATAEDLWRRRRDTSAKKTHASDASAQSPVRPVYAMFSCNVCMLPVHAESVPHAGTPLLRPELHSNHFLPLDLTSALFSISQRPDACNSSAHSGSCQDYHTPTPSLLA